MSTEELMLLNCGVGENSWESLDCKEIQPVHPKGDQSWIVIGRTDVEAAFGQLMRRTDSFERPFHWERLKAGEGDNRGWDGWMSSLTWWAWVGASSRSWWRTGRPAVHEVAQCWTRLSDWTELRKTALMNPSVEQQQRRRHREQTVDTVGEGEAGPAWESITERRASAYARCTAVGTCRVTQGTQNGARWQPGGWLRREVGGRLVREGTHGHLWLTHADVEQKSTRRCKAIILQLKI